MSTKWYLFAIANYIFLLGHTFFLIVAFIVSAGAPPPGEFLLFILCLGIIVINSVFNLYIFHGYMPGRECKPTLRRKYIVSTTFFLGAFLGLTYNFIRVLSDNEDSESGLNDFIKWVLVLNSIIGLFILITQFSVIKFIEKNTRAL